MFTLFSIPKPFAGHIGVIQHNALASWARLAADCEVIIFGDEAGAAAAAAEHGFRHVPSIARNARGTPLVNDLFAQARRLARHPVLLYSNADILFTADLPRAVQCVGDRQRFLLCGRRRNLDVDGRLDFSGDWQARLQRAVAQRGELAIPGAIDYFAFPRDLFDALPPFAVGRVEWDQWLLFRARALGAALIDASDCILAVHQNHDYAHLTDAPRDEIDDEMERNRDLALFHRLDLRDATHLLTVRGLRRALDREHLTRRLFCLPKYYLPDAPPVRRLYSLWRRRVRGIARRGELTGDPSGAAASRSAAAD